MRREDHVDYHLVQDEHLAVHADLENWRRWVRPLPSGWHVAPMFRFYRPDNFERSPATPMAPVNVPDAMAMERAIAQLPDVRIRRAIRWCYYYSQLTAQEARDAGYEYGPPGMARSLGVTKQGLLDLIKAGRSMLKNRGA